jgi:hypothetical protein
MVMVADLGAAHAAEKFLCPIGASAVHNQYSLKFSQISVLRAVRGAY